MPTVTDAHRRIAAQLVELERAATDDVAGAAVRVHDRAEPALAAVIGQNGVRALFARSLAICSKQYPALLAGGTVRLDEPMARTLRASWERLAKAEAHPAAITLYASFFALLTSFIGNEVASRLLGAAWPGVSVTFEDQRPP